MARLSTSDRAYLVDRFRRYLREHHLPLTAQRDQIAGVVCQSEAHLSAADIQRTLAEHDVAVGTATVYRTLDLLVQSGLARAYDFGDGFKRYEAVTADGGHGHLVCTRCHAVEAFGSERLERMLPIIADEHGFLHRRHRVEVSGLCRECRTRDLAW